jgi:predicted RecA/RadA family phage recombinase
MQAVLVSEGNLIDYTPGSAVVAGQVVVQGSVVGIASGPIAANTPGALNTSGLYKVVKVVGAITAGVNVYWDADGDPVGGTAGTGAVTTVSTGNTLIGWAIAAAASGDATVLVKLANVQGAEVYSQLSQPLTDPGDAGAIYNAATGYVPLVTAGAETRTLAIPTVVGVELLLMLYTDGGDCVVTVASAVNQTGNNTLTFAEVGDSIRLVSVAYGGALAWRIAHNDGVALSTV